MLDHPHRLVAREAFAHLLEHGRREVQSDAGAPGPGELHEAEQPPIAGAEIEDASGLWR
jgi:hypothetical protein